MTATDEESAYTPGVRHFSYRLEEMGVAIVLPAIGQPLVLRGNDSDKEQVTNLGRRDRAVALLQDAIRLQDADYSTQLPVPMPYGYPR